MKKKWVSAAEAALCAALALVSCSGHPVSPAVTVESSDDSFITGMQWETPDGSTLVFFSDGSGSRNNAPLSWQKNGSLIKFRLYPEALLGRSGVINEYIYNGLPMLRSGSEKYVPESFCRKKESPADSAPAEEELSAEEIIALEGQTAANMSFGFIGYNYKYGGKTPETGFDCSGLVYYIYEQLGYSLERTSNYQAKQGILIAKEDVQPGDILCFGAPDYCSHVGIYAGQGYYIHAMGAEYGVVATSLDDAYIKRPKYEVRRIVGCDWLKTENIENALSAGLPAPTPPVYEEQP